MKIAIVTPSQNTLLHRVRGTGFYIKNLESSLRKFDKNNTYVSCTPKSIPRDADIIHYPYFEPFFLTLPFLEKRKIAVTVHDLIPFVFPKRFPAGAKGRLRWEIQKRLLKKADAIITDSNSSKKDIEKFTGIKDSKISVIYLAASEKFKKLQNFKLKYNLPDKFILYVGDVTWNKNLPNLIKAVEKNDLPLVMVGKALIDEDFDKKNPWNKDLLEVQAQSLNNKKIIRLGFVSDNDLVMLYNKATVFAMPSFYEGFGLPILEAMSCGCPVITSKSGSITEVAGSAAFYTDPYNIDRMADDINKVFLDEKLRAELSKKGMIQAKKFLWEKTARETVKVYESLI